MKIQAIERRTRPRSKSVLDRLLDPVAETLNARSAAAIVEIRLDPTARERIDELAAKANEGNLTVEERAEYEAYVNAMDMIAILQSKARKLLANKH
jgi:hypothetical protein